MTSLLSCPKDCMATRVITLLRVHVTSLTTFVSIMRFLVEKMFMLKAIKSSLTGHMIIVVTSYEIYETR